MPDDTATTLSHVLGCDTWDVVQSVRDLVARDELLRISARQAEDIATARAARIADLERQLGRERDHPGGLARVQRIRLASSLAPAPGPYRNAILAALRRGKEWGDITAADYVRLNSMPCHYCAGPLGNGIGLDRLDVRRGYFLDNVVPSCGPCNIARHRTEGGRRPAAAPSPRRPVVLPRGPAGPVEPVPIVPSRPGGPQ